jgi:hypothetical protein
MARATRSKPKAKEPTPEPPVSDVKPLPASTSNPPKLFVLPKDTSPDARIVTLDNPANSTPSRYFFCPQKGFYEFTRISAPKKDCRSWLITGEDDKTDGDTKQDQDGGRIGSGYITKSADMFIATPIDILFLLLPVLAPTSAKDTKQHFLALDEYFDKLSASSRHWRALLSQHASLKERIEKRMRAVCDSVDAGDESMYRLSQPKLLGVLTRKAERMAKGGLPPSLEEKFVKQKLEIPMMTVMREESSLSGTSTSPSTGKDSQVSVETSISTPDDAPAKSESTDTPTQPDPPLTTPENIPPLLRIHTSLSYLSSTYLPSTLHPLVSTHLSSSLFLPLTTHLASIQHLKSSALALRAISDNTSRKRGYEDDDEKIAEREEKKRKKEEEERKKKSEGRGVKALKKVDVSGMRKMSAFFTAVPKKKA